MTGQRFDLPPGDYLVQIALPVEEGEVTRTTAVPIKLAPGEHRELSMRDPIGALRDALAETAVAVLLETGRGGVDAVRELAPQAASAMRELGEASVAGLREIVFSSPRMQGIAATLAAAANRIIAATPLVGPNMMFGQGVKMAGSAVQALSDAFEEGRAALGFGALARRRKVLAEFGPVLIIQGLGRRGLVALLDGRMPDDRGSSISVAVPNARLAEGIAISEATSLLLLLEGPHPAAIVVPVDASGPTRVRAAWPEVADEPAVAPTLDFPQVALEFSDPVIQTYWSSLRLRAYPELRKLAAGEAAMAQSGTLPTEAERPLARLIGVYVLLRTNQLALAAAELERLGGTPRMAPDVAVLRAEIAARGGNHEAARAYLAEIDDTLPQLRLCIDYGLRRMRGYLRAARATPPQGDVGWVAALEQLEREFSRLADAMHASQYCLVLQLVGNFGRAL